jgi:peptidoglycan/xylan/chitin deacetylase (PgdA/CDA1 family)
LPSHTAVPHSDIDIVTPAPPKPSVSASTGVSPSVEPPSEPTGEPVSAPPKVNCKKQKCVALTIDDGPSPLSGKVLDALAAKDVKATFFLMGSRVEQYPKAVKRMGAEGHSVQNHSYSHPQFGKMSADRIRGQLQSTNKLIKKQTGVQPTLFRPPYGQTNATVRKIGKELGMAQVLWSVDPNDWKDKDTDTVVQRVVGATKPGSIILTHELYPTTLAAYPIIIDKLRAKGYTFVTIPELVGVTPKPGVNYSSGVKPKAGKSKDVKPKTDKPKTDKPKTDKSQS